MNHSTSRCFKVGDKVTHINYGKDVAGEVIALDSTWAVKVRWPGAETWHQTSYLEKHVDVIQDERRITLDSLNQRYVKKTDEIAADQKQIDTYQNLIANLQGRIDRTIVERAEIFTLITELEADN